MQPRRYYSQNGEDLLLWSLFSGQERGFFVDVGAFDGVHYSNSLSFEEQGWSGICVEAHPDFFPICEKSRPRSTCIFAACVGKDGGERVMLQAEPLGLLSGIRASETPNLSERYARRSMRFPGFRSVEVPAMTLDRILREHPPPASGIDFVSIDVEGTELDVLEGFSRTARIIVAEANDPAGAKALADYMAGRGYSLARTLKMNLFFARKRDDLQKLREASVAGVTERTLHPLGQQATVIETVGRAIEIGPVPRVTSGRAAAHLREGK